ELSRTASLLRSATLAKLVWPQYLGITLACCAGKHWLRLAGVEIRAVGRTKCKSNRRAGHGDLSRVRFLRALRHSRSVAASIHDDVHPRAAWPVETWHARIPLVRRDGTSRYDSNKGDIHHSRDMCCSRNSRADGF